MIEAVSKKSGDTLWSFMGQLVANKEHVIKSVDAGEKLILTAAYEYVLGEICLLSNTKCHSCSGFGHQMKNCPTNAKLTVFGSSGARHSSIISHVRAVVEASEGHYHAANGRTSNLKKRLRKDVGMVTEVSPTEKKRLKSND